MFVVRDAGEDDLPDLVAVARLLDTVNLPHDRGVLEELIAQSRLSFGAKLEAADRRFLFVLEDLEQRRVVGTSSVHAQHGTRRAPHVFFDVLAEERYSETIDRHVRHRVLRIGYDFDGPTEVGGLILAPAYRKGPGQLGRVLSFARFLFIAAQRSAFRPEVLAELLPPLEADGSSALWRTLGEGFTGMTYQEADRLSQKNKEFIRALFPQETIYASLLPANVQAQIGEVGPMTKGVERMLRSIGFAYANRIDPFDGGPHFVAKTDAISLVRDACELRVSTQTPETSDADVGLVATLHAGFRACTTTYERSDDGELLLPEASRRALGVVARDRVWLEPREALRRAPPPASGDR